MKEKEQKNKGFRGKLKINKKKNKKLLEKLENEEKESDNFEDNFNKEIEVNRKLDIILEKERL